ncbi:hypothetical protein HHX47_DHR6000525 [Lentinula edodes]|nr:hypothetical protein HHX47_DHR6000525 [Lentinula edodes]
MTELRYKTVQNQVKNVDEVERLAFAPQFAYLRRRLINTPNDALAQTLEEIDAWKWQRSDLNAWIKVLNKFDTVLEDVIREYDIDKLQLREFSTESKKMVSKF